MHVPLTLSVSHAYLQIPVPFSPESDYRGLRVERDLDARAGPLQVLEGVFQRRRLHASKKGDSFLLEERKGEPGLFGRAALRPEGLI